MPRETAKPDPEKAFQSIFAFSGSFCVYIIGVSVLSRSLPLPLFYQRGDLPRICFTSEN